MGSDPSAFLQISRPLLPFSPEARASTQGPSFPKGGGLFERSLARCSASGAMNPSGPNREAISDCFHKWHNANALPKSALECWVCVTSSSSITLFLHSPHTHDVSWLDALAFIPIAPPGWVLALLYPSKQIDVAIGDWFFVPIHVSSLFIFPSLTTIDSLVPSLLSDPHFWSPYRNPATSLAAPIFLTSSKPGKGRVLCIKRTLSRCLARQ